METEASAQTDKALSRLTADYLGLCLQAPQLTASFARLLQNYGSLAALRHTEETADWLNKHLHTDAINTEGIERALQWHKSAGQHLILFESDDYPARLREIDSPPPILFVAGDKRCLHQPALAMVGSRRCSIGGASNARWVARQCSQYGLTIVSGLATGIDASAHRGALDAGKPTIAVLGTGIEQVYPRQNLALAEQIKCCGALVSEFPLGTPAFPANFPRRNRIVTGLSLGVLVVEAEVKSGSLISARLAMEQNREVFAMPGPPGARQSAGCHNLIRQGAILVDQVEQIIEELADWLPVNETDKVSNVSASQAEQRQAVVARLSATGKRILQRLQGQSCLPDELQAALNMPWPQVSGGLQELELAGLIRQEGGRVIPLMSLG